jgi:hypothetical protein
MMKSILCGYYNLIVIFLKVLGTSYTSWADFLLKNKCTKKDHSISCCYSKLIWVLIIPFSKFVTLQPS